LRECERVVAFFSYNYPMGRGADETNLKEMGLTPRSRLDPEKLLRDELTAPREDSPFPSVEEEVAYCRAILDEAGVKKGDIAFIMTLGEEASSARLSFMEAAADIGAQVVVGDPTVVSESNEDLLPMVEAYERVAEGEAVRIGVRSMNGLGHTERAQHPDHIEYMNTEEGVSKRADRRDELIERFIAAQEKAEERNAEGNLRQSGTKWPTPAWAEQVFPEESPEDALRMLVDVLQKATRAGDLAGQREARARLKRRASLLNEGEESKFSEVKIVSPPETDHPKDIGTSLSVGMARGSKFVSCHDEDSEGNEMGINLPTDEVYTTPHREKVSGHFTTTRPYVAADDEGNTVIVQGMVGRFDDDGKLHLEAFDKKHQAILDRDFNDEGQAPTNVLAELGLVDSSGPLAQSGRTFFDTMLDENVGVHLGFGKSWSNFTGGHPDDIAPRVASANHFDLVIGSAQTSVIGIERDGSKRALILDGLWQDEYR
jgi:leucyl aminopeptidase (aminopeptidase T)